MMIDKGNQMHQYLVYQLPFEHSLKRDMGFFEAWQIEEISDEYVVVAQASARSLNEVFEMGNGIAQGHRGGEMRTVGQMHSISVGDIISDLQTGEDWVVAPFGFTKINMKECV